MARTGAGRGRPGRDPAGDRNRLFDAVRRLVETRVLGDTLHGSFENFATDENLPAEHWFWDRGKSGGIEPNDQWDE